MSLAKPLDLLSSEFLELNLLPCIWTFVCLFTSFVLCMSLLLEMRRSNNMLLTVFFISRRGCIVYILKGFLQLYSNFCQSKCSYMWIQVPHQNMHTRLSILDMLSDGQPDIFLFFFHKWLPARHGSRISSPAVQVHGHVKAISLQSFAPSH
jgi:hypothetical protein